MHRLNFLIKRHTRINALLVLVSFSLPIFINEFLKSKALLEGGEKGNRKRDESCNTSFVLYDGFCGKTAVTQKS